VPAADVLPAATQLPGRATTAAASESPHSSVAAACAAAQCRPASAAVTAVAARDNAQCEDPVCHSTMQQDAGPAAAAAAAAAQLAPAGVTRVDVLHGLSRVSRPNGNALHSAAAPAAVTDAAATLAVSALAAAGVAVGRTVDDAAAVAAVSAAGLSTGRAVVDAAQLHAAQQVCQLLAAVAVMLRVDAGDQLPAALQALRSLPELPEGDARGLCSLCGHYEALTAYAVSRRLCVNLC
jgi:hypothetical protein